MGANASPKCDWVEVKNMRCGYDCNVDVNIGAGGQRYDAGVSDVNTCIQKCQRSSDCFGFNYALPRTGGSGGPGSTSWSTGTCYYRSSISCGSRCDSGRVCYNQQNFRCECDGSSECANITEITEKSE